MRDEFAEPSGFIVGRGPRACEALLVERLQVLMPKGRPQDLQQPVLVVVPSGTLRRQLLRNLSRDLAPALLGFEVALLPTLAQRILARAGAPARPGAEYYDLLVRRAAAQHEALKRALDDFEEAYGLCVSSARDLASAGLGQLDPVQVSARLAELPASEERARAEALCILVRDVQAELAQLGLERRGDVLARAAMALRAGGETLLPHAQLIIHGFADAPGQTCEFLRALLELPNAEIIFDIPPEPSDANQETKAKAYLQRFARSLGQSLPEDQKARRSPLCSWQAFDAVGREAEVREVAWRIEGFLAAGSRPEDIAVVSRNLEAYAPEIRRQFAELGLPLSGTDLGRGFHPQAEALQALGKLLSQGSLLGVSQFCALLGCEFSAARGTTARNDLKLGLRQLGLSDLKRIAAHPKSSDADDGRDQFIELPVLRGLSRPDAPARSAPRLLPIAALDAAIDAAVALLSWLTKAEEEAPVASQAESLKTLLQTALGQTQKTAPWLQTLHELSQNSATLAVTRKEFRQLFEQALDRDFSVSLGGRGLGVQVLNIAQARAMTFSKLFILGLNAKTLPAPGREDPILSDEMRDCLRQDLPLLGRHRDRPEEESFLFAQLMEAAGEITLSWMRADDDGKELARSPFVERLVLSGLETSATPRALEERFAAARERNATLALRDRQLLSALSGRNDDREQLRAEEIDNYRADVKGFEEIRWPDSRAVAAAQVQVIAEVEATHYDEDGRRRCQRLSPFMGSTGTDNLRQMTPLWITTLENIARCPWQTFLGRELKLKVLPDPEIRLPDIDGLLLGNAAHDALQFLYDQASVKAGQRPTESDIIAACSRAAKRVAERADLNLAGLIGVLQLRARPFVERALALDWQGESGPVVEATERAFMLEIPSAKGGKRELHFRADRVDQTDSNQQITDYKTGSPISPNKGDDSRYEKHLDAISSGTHLQAAAYALAGGRGRYLFINPKVEDHAAIFAIDRSDDLKLRFEATTGIIEAAWSAGLLPPRLEEARSGHEPVACQYCEFEAACIRGDSGLRRRLAGLAQSLSTDQKASLLADLWNLKDRSQARLEQGANE